MEALVEEEEVIWVAEDWALLSANSAIDSQVDQSSCI